MEDIAPGLLDAIREEFTHRIQRNRKILTIYDAIQKGTAAYQDVGVYAYEIGDALSRALHNHLSSAVLPDGRMYYNIADRVLRPLLEENQGLISDAALRVQTDLNKKAGIGLKAQPAQISDDRIACIVDKVSDAENFDDVAWVLDEPVKTFSQSVVDQTLKANVDFQGRAGLCPKVIRKAGRKCCDWCQALAGEYEYPDVPDDVYRRHQNCRCTVEYDPGDGKRQNVHTKQWTNAKEYATLKTEKAPRTRPEARKARGMANGPRRGGLTRVSPDEEALIRQYAKELNIPENVLSFNSGSCTSFDDARNIIHIRGDVFPSAFAENPDSILSAKCALAHEYYGHYLHHTQFDAGDWRDEFQASYRAALDAPGLTPDERSMLMLDAFERPRNAGVSVEMNSVARRLLYGFD